MRHKIHQLVMLKKFNFVQGLKKIEAYKKKIIETACACIIFILTFSFQNLHPGCYSLLIERIPSFEAERLPSRNVPPKSIFGLGSQIRCCCQGI